MKRMSMVVLIGLFMIPALSRAQDPETRIGFGVGMTSDYVFLSDDLIALPISLNNFSVIIRSSNFRIEPRIGFLSTSTKREYSGSSTTESSMSITRLGLAAAYQMNKGSTYYYYGLGFGLILTSQSSSTTNPSTNVDKSKTDFFIGPLIGGEYMFSEDFSLGGEIQLNYISVGQYDSDSPTAPDVTESAFSTRMKVTIRWYL